MVSDNDKPVLVGLGEILWDMLETETREKGRWKPLSHGKQLGGAPANFAYHAQALGSKGVVASSIGDDELGREILSRLKELGLETGYIEIDKKHPTGTVSVKLDKAGKPDYTIHENVAWDFIPSSEKLLKLAGSSDAVCFGSLCQRCEVSRNTIRNFLQNAGTGCLRVFDINLRQSYYNREVIEKSLQYADVLKLNDEELPILAGLLNLTASQTDLLSQLTSKYKLRMIALTRGSSGSLLYADGKSSDHKGFPTEVADTVGAGDAFAAAVALGILNNKELDEINDFANRLAGFVCSRPGATPKLPEQFIRP